MVAEVALTARADRDTLIPAEHGGAIRGWLYGVLKAGDPAYSSLIHDNQQVPMTCSSVQGGRVTDAGMLSVRQGETLSVRLTTMHASALRTIEEGLAALGPAIELTVHPHGTDRARSLAATIIDAAAVRTASYADLTGMTRARHWSLRFLSRTRFSSGARGILAPTPQLIFTGLVRKWNMFGQDSEGKHPLPIAVEPFADFVDSSVSISQIVSLRTEPAGADTRKQRGFVGEVCLSLDGDVPHAFFSQFSALMNYAPFAGIGERTVEGWGQVDVCPWRED